MTDKKEPIVDLRWLHEGKEDPHPHLVTRKREELVLAEMSDEELGYYAFMNYNRSVAEEGNILFAIGRGVENPGIPRIAFMTAVQERLRWLSRQLAIAEGRYPGVSRPLTEDDVMSESLKSATAGMMETDPSRGLPHFETINKAETSIGLSQRSYFDPEEAAYYIEDYLRTADLEALLFAARVRELAKDFKELGNVEHVSVNQLRQVILPGRGLTELDANIFSPENDPHNQLYFHSDRAVNAEGVVTRNKHGLSGVMKGADGKIEESWHTDYNKPSNHFEHPEAAAEVLRNKGLTFPSFKGMGQERRFNLDGTYTTKELEAILYLRRRGDDPERTVPVISGSLNGGFSRNSMLLLGMGQTHMGLSNIRDLVDSIKPMVISPKSVGLRSMPDYEGDSMLPPNRNLPLSNPRQSMFASTALGKLLARAKTTQQLSTHDTTRPPKPLDENWEGEPQISNEFVLHHSVRPRDGQKFVTQCDRQGTPLNKVEKN